MTNRTLIQYAYIKRILSFSSGFPPMNVAYLRNTRLLAGLILANSVAIQPVLSQPIPSPSDSTGTIVTSDGNRFDITGGSLSQDGANLFHSFEQFGLSSNQIANFLSNPTINNILARVVGGDPSIINGLIQVTGGNSNLYLMNPAGIILGQNSQLNVPGDFIATTATGIGFDGGWFEGLNSNNYSNLLGNPHTFAFNTVQPGAIINAGDLAVSAGQKLALIGGTILNTGNLVASGGTITVTAVPGTHRVRLSQEGQILSLEIQPLTDSQGNLSPIEPQMLPELLTNSGGEKVTGIRVNRDRTLTLKESGIQIPTTIGTTIIAGDLDVSGDVGGDVQVFGDRVGLVAATINSTGIQGGGTVKIGGNYQGEGTIPNASHTYVSRDSVIQADAQDRNDGGEVIVWADQTTQFYGTISARGGVNSGDGGFVEVSGKENLAFDGVVDVGASSGENGQLFLDPKTVIIGTVGTNDNAVSDNQILTGDGAGLTFQISHTAIETALNNGNVSIAALKNIDINEDINSNSSNSLTFEAAFINLDASIRLNGGNLTFDSPVILRSNQTLSTGSTVGGDITFNSSLHGLSGGEPPTLTLDAGTGNVTFEGLVGGPLPYNVVALLDDPLGYWRLDDSGGTAVDASGNGNNGTYNTGVNSGQPGALVGDDNTATSFNGTTGFVSTPININQSNPNPDSITFTAWVKPNSTSAGRYQVVSSDSGYFDWSMLRENDQWAVFTGENIRYPGFQVDVNQWQHIAVVFQPGVGVTFYKNGQSVTIPFIDYDTNDDVSPPGYFGDNNIAIGNNAASYFDEHFDGSIDEVAVYDSALSQQQILDQYSAGRGRGADNPLGGLIVTTADTITANQGIQANTIDLTANQISLQDVTTTSTGNAVSLTADEINLNGGVDSVAGIGDVQIQPRTVSQDIVIADNSDTAALDLSPTDLTALQDGFKSITIGRSDGTGIITLNSFSFTDPVTIAGGSTLIGPDINTTYQITDTDAGEVSGFNESLSFASIENLTGGTANDTFRVNNGGSISGRIDGGTGNDSLIGANAANTWAITDSNEGTINGITNFSAIENLTGGTDNDIFQLSNSAAISGTVNGGTGNDSLIGANANNTWTITASNSGNVNGTINFSAIENLTGGTENDTFQLSNGAAVSGTIDGGTGNDRLIGANANNTWRITAPNTGTINGTSAFSAIENLTGGTENDRFQLSNDAVISGRIDGGGGNDSLIGANAANTWTITALNSGNVNGITNFSAIENLTGGSEQDTFQLSNGAAVSGTIDGRENSDDYIINLSNTGSAITTITDSGTTGSDTLAIQGTNTTDNLDITATQLTRESQTVNYNSSIENLDVDTGLGNDKITVRESLTFAGNVSLSTGLDGGDITTGNITAKDGITLMSQPGIITTGDLNASGTRGGTIRIQAGDRIITGKIDTSGMIGDGGDVFLDPDNGILVESINAQGGINGRGGNVDITTQQFFQATGIFSDQNGISASISTAGGNGGGDIIIRHDGGARNTPFEVGNAQINGTAGAITTSATNSILPLQSFPGAYTQRDIQLITQNPPTPPPTPPAPPVLIPDEIVKDFQGIQPSPLSLIPEEESDELILRTVNRLDIARLLDQNQIPQAVLFIDILFSEELASYINQQVSRELKSFADIQERLNQTAAATGEKPAVLYTFSRAEQLDLVLVTPSGIPIHKSIPAARRDVLLKKVAELRRDLANPVIRNTNSYLDSAQQLYQWLIAPLEAELQKEGIQTIVFSMDAGLRAIPVAALHDGQQFLVQKYSLGLIPSVNLTDTRYQPLDNAQVLAMGASKFREQSPLPAVPLEVSTIANQIWQGKSFINAEFTLNNLKSQRQNQPFRIIHLATHGEFKPGEPENSYIQLFDTKLQLDQLRQLGWNNPPVELLVLSACRTAVGDEDAELGFAGLAVQAGVKSALGSLWNVSDEGTLGLMTEFYRQLHNAPIKAEALRQAQIAMLQGKVRLQGGQLQVDGENLTLPPELSSLEDKELSHPYYWSAFTMIGSPW